MREGHDVGRVGGDSSAWVDRYGTAALVSAPSLEEAEALWERLEKEGKTGIFTSVYFRKLVHGPGETDCPVLLSGASLPEAFRVWENGLGYEVDFTGGYSTGLFADQQENRLRLREFRPSRVLNLFAYTCAFSVAAGVVGAETTSVDLAGRCLERGRRNFECNGMDPKAHRFFKEDVFSFLRRAVRRGEVFDGVVVDPPTFSRGEGGRIFRAERDWPALLDSVFPVVGEEAAVLLSTNCRSLDGVALGRLARAAAERAGWRGWILERGSVPPEYEGTPCSSTVWMVRGGAKRKVGAESGN